MSSIIYNSFFADVESGAINLENDSFKAMLVAAAYTESKGGHSKRSSITNEVVGTGYTAGGVPCAVTRTQDNIANTVDAAFAGVAWPTSTLTARKLIIYKARGGAASADELVACIDFGGDVSSTAATLSVGATTIRVQN